MKKLIDIIDTSNEPNILQMSSLNQHVIEFHSQQKKIQTEQQWLLKMEKNIIDKYCQYKKGDKVIYTEWWRGNGKDYFGIVSDIRFKGTSSDAIDGMWIICVTPTTKDFKKSLANYNSAFKYLGINSKDIIRKAN
jgi:hypothetical protein